MACSVSTWVCGATLGKTLLSLRVVRADGGRPSFGQALGCEALVYVDSFLFGLIAAQAMDRSPYHQRVGDSSVGTMVIHAARVSVPARTTFGVLALACCWSGDARPCWSRRGSSSPPGEASGCRARRTQALLTTSTAG